MPLRTYLAKFQSQVDMLLSVGINLGAGPGMENFIATLKAKTGITGVARAMELGNSTPGKITLTEEYIIKKDDINKRSNEVYLAICFLLGADRKLYGKLAEDLHNQHIKRYDDYPKTVDAAYALLCETNFNPNYYCQPVDGDGGGTGMVFNQDGTVRGKRKHKERTCWHCNKPGHTNRNCLDLKEKDKDGTNNSQVSVAGMHNVIEAISPECMDELRGGQDNIDQAAQSTADPPFESSSI